MDKDTIITITSSAILVGIAIYHIAKSYTLEKYIIMNDLKKEQTNE